jgi:Mg/Co/Ni transporter MgtE
MNKEKMLEIVNEVINEKLENLMEEMSTNEFVEMITDMYVDQTGEVIEDTEEVQEIIGERVIPLLTKITEYVIGVDLPKV